MKKYNFFFYVWNYRNIFSEQKMNKIIYGQFNMGTANPIYGTWLNVATFCVGSFKKINE